MSLLFEIFFEFVGQLCFELFGELIAAGLKRLTGGRFELRRGPVYFLIAILGFGLGFISLEIYGPIIKNVVLQIANMIGTPFLMGFIFHYIGVFKEAKGKNPLVFDRFLGGYLFALAFAVARFAFAN